MSILLPGKKPHFFGTLKLPLPGLSARSSSFFPEADIAAKRRRLLLHVVVFFAAWRLRLGCLLTALLCLVIPVGLAAGTTRWTFRVGLFWHWPAPLGCVRVWD
jgi:hypothetical protein